MITEEEWEIIARVIAFSLGTHINQHHVGVNDTNEMIAFHRTVKLTVEKLLKDLKKV